MSQLPVNNHLAMLSSLNHRNRGSHLNKYPTQPLLTNLFKVHYPQNGQVFIYAAKSQPEISPQNSRKFRTMLLQSQKPLQRLIGTYAVSGRTIFGCRPPTCSKGAEISLKVEFQGQVYHLFLKLLKEVSLSDVESLDPRKSGIIFSFLNSLVRNFFHQVDYTEIGRSRKYFNSMDYEYLETAKVSVYRGYSSGFSLLEKGLFLRMDPAVKIVRSETVLEVIDRIYALNGGLSKSQKRRAVEMELVGKMVMANYGRNIYHTIQQVIFDARIDSYCFHNGIRSISLTQYYQDTYNIQLTKRQPLIKALLPAKVKQRQTGKKEVILIPEFLLMSGLPADVDESKRRQICDLTIVSPVQKMEDILNIFHTFNSQQKGFGPNLVSQRLNIRLQSQPVHVTGRQLPIPQLQLGRGQVIQEHKATNFLLYNRPLYDGGVPLDILVLCAQDIDLGQVKSLFRCSCCKLGLEYRLEHFRIKSRDERALLVSIQQIVIRMRKRGSNNMFWVIMPSKFRSSYGAIKRIMVGRGVQSNSQVCLSSTLFRKNFNSVMTKLLLQMAAKVGNKLWLPLPLPQLQSTGVLLIGIDSYNCVHDPTLSVLSYCCNTNRQCSSFLSKYFLHSKNEGTNTYINEIMLSCLGQYRRVSKCDPTEVFLLKRGIRKDESKVVVQHEVKEVRMAFRHHGCYRTSLTYVILDKDTHQKFFGRRGQEVTNPQSGTLVTSEAVGSGFEFYLVAQHCSRGTVRPTFYRVVYTDSGMEEGLMQELLFNQCFNYMNWTGSVKIPSVLQYAKKLAMFVGQHLANDPVGDSLHANLYYL